MKLFRITKFGKKGRKLRTMKGNEVSHEELLRGLVFHFALLMSNVKRDPFAICKDCSSLIEVGQRGVVPKRCLECRELQAKLYWNAKGKYR